MIDILTLKERAVEAKALIPEIQFLDFVASDDELIETLQERTSSDNIMMVCVIPSYSGFGVEDESGFRSYLNFFFLEKTDYKKMKNRDDYLAVFQRTLSVARQFISEVFAIDGSLCISAELEHKSLAIRAVTRKAQCNGYLVEIDEKKHEEF